MGLGRFIAFLSMVFLLNEKSTFLFINRNFNGTPKWLAQTKEKAIRRNEALEKTLRDDAIWVVNKKLGR